MEKITKRAMFEALISYAEAMLIEMTAYSKNDSAPISLTSADIVAFMQNEIAQLDKKAEKARTRAAEKRGENDPLTNAVFAALGTDLQTAADIAGNITGEDVTVAKVSYRLTALTKAGKAVKEDMRVVNSDGKRSVLKGYRLA